MSLNLGTLHIRIRPDMGGTLGAVKQLENRVSGLAALGSRLSLKVTAPIAAAAAGAVQAFAAFDDAMTSSLAIYGKTTDTIRKQMESTARAISERSRTGAVEVAKGYGVLISAGFSLEQSMKAIATAERFAVAGFMQLETATTLLAQSQFALGLASEDPIRNMQQMNRVADVLSMANAKASGTIEQFARALASKGAPALRSANKSLEEGVAALMVYAERGRHAEIAGELLNVTLRELDSVSRKFSASWRRFGVAIYDSRGQMRKLWEILGDMEKRLQGLSPQARAATLAFLGFTDLSSTAIKTLLGTSGRMKEFYDDLANASGKTMQIAEDRLKSFTAQMLITWHQIQGVGADVGRILAPAIGGLNEHLRHGVTLWKSLTDEQKKFAVWGTLAAAAVGPAIAAVGWFGGVAKRAYAAASYAASTFGDVVLWLGKGALTYLRIRLDLTWAALKAVGNVGLYAFNGLVGGLMAAARAAGAFASAFSEQVGDSLAKIADYAKAKASQIKTSFAFWRHIAVPSGFYAMRLAISGFVDDLRPVGGLFVTMRTQVSTQLAAASAAFMRFRTNSIRAIGDAARGAAAAFRWRLDWNRLMGLDGAGGVARGLGQVRRAIQVGLLDPLGIKLGQLSAKIAAAFSKVRAVVGEALLFVRGGLNLAAAWAGRKFGELAAAVATKWAAALAAVSAVVGSAKQLIQRALSATIDFISSLPQRVAAGAKRALSLAKAAIIGIGQLYADMFMPLITGAIEAAKQVGSKLASAAKWTAAKFSEAAVAITAKLRSAATWVGVQFRVAGAFAAAALRVAATVAAAAWVRFADRAVRVLRRLAVDAIIAGAVVGAAMLRAFESARRAAAAASNWVAAKFASAFAVLGALAQRFGTQMMRAARVAGHALAAIGRMYADMLMPLISGAAAAARWVGSRLAAAGRWVAAAWSAVASAIGSRLAAAFSAVASVAVHLGRVSSLVWRGLTTAAGSALMLVRSYLQATWDGIRAGAIGSRRALRIIWEGLKDVAGPLGRATGAVGAFAARASNIIGAAVGRLTSRVAGPLTRLFSWPIATSAKIAGYSVVGFGMLSAGVMRGISAGAIAAGKSLADSFRYGARSAAVNLRMLSRSVKFGGAAAKQTESVASMLEAGEAAMALTGVLTSMPVLLAGAGYAFVQFTDVGRQAFERIAAFAKPTTDVIKKAFGGVSDALKAGDMRLALDIAFTGIQSSAFEMLNSIYGDMDSTLGTIANKLFSGDLLGAWQTVMLEMGNLWDSLWSGAVGMAADFVGGALNMWKSAVDAIANYLIEKDFTGHFKEMRDRHASQTETNVGFMQRTKARAEVDLRAATANGDAEEAEAQQRIIDDMTQGIARARGEISGYMADVKRVASLTTASTADSIKARMDEAKQAAAAAKQAAEELAEFDRKGSGEKAAKKRAELESRLKLLNAAAADMAEKAKQKEEELSEQTLGLKDNLEDIDGKAYNAHVGVTGINSSEALAWAWFSRLNAMREKFNKGKVKLPAAPVAAGAPSPASPQAGIPQGPAAAISSTAGVGAAAAGNAIAAIPAPPASPKIKTPAVMHTLDDARTRDIEMKIPSFASEGTKSALREAEDANRAAAFGLESAQDAMTKASRAWLDATHAADTAVGAAKAGAMKAMEEAAAAAVKAERDLEEAKTLADKRSAEAADVRKKAEAESQAAVIPGAAALPEGKTGNKLIDQLIKRRDGLQRIIENKTDKTGDVRAADAEKKKKELLDTQIRRAQIKAEGKLKPGPKVGTPDAGAPAAGGTIGDAFMQTPNVPEGSDVGPTGLFNGGYLNELYGIPEPSVVPTPDVAPPPALFGADYLNQLYGDQPMSTAMPTPAPLPAATLDADMLEVMQTIAANTAKQIVIQTAEV